MYNLKFRKHKQNILRHCCSFPDWFLTREKSSGTNTNNRNVFSRDTTNTVQTSADPIAHKKKLIALFRAFSETYFSRLFYFNVSLYLLLNESTIYLYVLLVYTKYLSTAMLAVL